jgi:hypothetical protein
MFSEAFSSPTMTHCVLSGNAAPLYGGAVFNYSYASAELVNCVLSYNTAGTIGGALTNNRSCTATLHNCTIAGCSAALGSGLACDAPGGHPSQIEVVDCILWNAGSEGVITDASLIEISYSDVEGGPAGIYVGTGGFLDWGAGNLDADPLFVNGPLGSFYLSQIAAGQASDSPCVDAGSDAASNLDLDMLTTRTDEESDAGVVDMGYHYPYEDCDGDGVRDQLDVPGDFDGDDAVTLDDVGPFVQVLLDPSSGCRALADMNHDGSADGLDVRVFVEEVVGSAM